jgi:hypothetical protein
MTGPDSGQELDLANLPHSLDSSAIDGEDDVPKDLAEYEDRVIAFIDILGFSELVRRSASDSTQLRRLSQALLISPQLADNLPTQPKAHREARIHTFSDFVVVSHEKTPQGLSAVIYLSWQIAKDWLSKGFLPRGGIAIGKLIHRTHNGNTSAAPMVFGPAFLDAYGVESGIANVARIALHSSARKYREEVLTANELSEQDRSVVGDLVTKCEDGPHAISTFSHLRYGGFSMPNVDVRTEAKQFKRELEVRLKNDADNPAHFAKVSWLANEFNRAVADTENVDLRVEFNA